MGSLLLDERLDTILNGLIGVTYLSNDEVKEDQHGEEHDHDPANPEDDVLSLTKFVTFEHSKIEVSEGDSECGQKVTGNHSNLVIFWSAWWGDDVEDHGEHDNKNYEENDENLKVNNDLKNHRDDETEALEDFHVEEGLDEAEDDGEKEDQNGIGVLWAFEKLEIATVISNDHMENIQPVDWNLSEFNETNLEHLLTIGVKWMEKHNKNDAQVVVPHIIGEEVFLVIHIVLWIQTTVFFLH